MAGLTRVGVFGSCRVRDPIALADKDGRLDYIYNPAIGFLHNPVEIHQAIDVMRGKRTYPLALNNLLRFGFDRRLGEEDLFDSLYGTADVLVVEISSLRLIDYQSWSLQINRVRDLATELGFDPAPIEQLFETPADRPDILASLAPTPESALYRDVIAQGVFTKLGSEPFYDAVKTMRQAYDIPTVLVGIAAQFGDGAMIGSRVRMNNVLRRIAHDMPRTVFFNPTALVERDGFATAMHDKSHYKPDYISVVADSLIPVIEGLYQGS